MLHFSENLRFLRKAKGYNQTEIANAIEFNRTTWGGYETGKSVPNFSDLLKIAEFFGIPETDLIHLDLSKSNLTEISEEQKEHEKGNLKRNLKGNLIEENTAYLEQRRQQKLLPQPHKIPFYDDVITFGGNNGNHADLQAVSQPVEYVDAGDWFKEATAAIRHYGDSMIEYPPGSILALKQVKDIRLIIPGRDYVIETAEYRVTKKVQKSKEKDCLRACSTNKDKYEDGSLIHEPFDIPMSAISNISLVLGYVVKKGGGTMVFNNNKK